MHFATHTIFLFKCKRFFRLSFHGFLKNRVEKIFWAVLAEMLRYICCCSCFNFVVVVVDDDGDIVVFVVVLSQNSNR